MQVPLAMAAAANTPPSINAPAASAARLLNTVRARNPARGDVSFIAFNFLTFNG
jgi:hypothetical protein